MAKPEQVTKFGPLAAFDPEAFRKLIQGRGLDYRWSRALECPCRLNAQTDQWDPTCDRCGGDGWMYVNPCAAQERHLARDFTVVKAVFSSVTDKPSVVEEFGSWHHGRATLTVQNEMRVGFRDRFIGSEQEMAFSETVRRGAVDLVPVGRHGLSRELQQTALRYEPVNINYVESDDGGTREIWYEGTDWMLKQGFGDGINQMQWLPGQGPAEDALVTIHYVIHPVWVVDEAMFNIQNSRGPEAGLKGSAVLQHLPTTFTVILDFLTPERSS